MYRMTHVDENVQKCTCMYRMTHVTLMYSRVHTYVWTLQWSYTSLTHSCTKRHDAAAMYVSHILTDLRPAECRAACTLPWPHRWWTHRHCRTHCPRRCSDTPPAVPHYDWLRPPVWYHCLCSWQTEWQHLRESKRTHPPNDISRFCSYMRPYIDMHVHTTYVCAFILRMHLRTYKGVWCRGDTRTSYMYVYYTCTWGCLYHAADLDKWPQHCDRYTLRIQMWNWNSPRSQSHSQNTAH